jgi:adenosylcobinamide kinase / adenosylcobinamide-phosphate guanylyltransferase
VAASHLIVGGARSGKSRYAVAVQPQRARVAFVATATAGDADMAARIARHQAERPGTWLTVEAPQTLVAAMRGLEGRVEAVVVDCLTLWVANLLLRGDPDQAILGQADELTTFITRTVCELTIVTNEVGEGVHPETAAGLRFRDLLGLVNQRVAAVCQRLTLMVAGVPLPIKAPTPSYDVAQQTP